MTKLLLILAVVSVLLGALTAAFIKGVRRSAGIAVKTWRTK